MSPEDQQGSRCSDGLNNATSSAPSSSTHHTSLVADCPAGVDRKTDDVPEFSDQLPEQGKAVEDRPDASHLNYSEDVPTRSMAEPNNHASEPLHSGGVSDYGPCFRCLEFLCCGSLSRCAKRNPRSFSFLFGVVGPIWLLILISYLFGWALAWLESPHEVDMNDAILQAHALLYVELEVYSNLTKSLPRVCLEIYGRNQTVDWFVSRVIETIVNSTSGDRFNGIMNMKEQLGNPLDFLKENSTWKLVDVEELYQFMVQCGEELTPLVNLMFSQVGSEGFAASTETLSFAWNRCPLDANETQQNYPFPFPSFLQQVPINSLLPSAQTEQYVRQWVEDFGILYQKNLAEYETNPDPAVLKNWTFKVDNGSAVANPLAQLNAFYQAVTQASGREGCILNLHASVWFWFTVMTTVGYGSQVPITSGGRIMVYSLGFLSILVFGAILANAGSIMTIIVDDFLARLGLHWARTATVSCFLWGLMAYLWMMVIAYQYKEWSLVLLGEGVDLNNAYWFAYISTTTIGLGDYILHPEVITSTDLVTFPLSFLIGFTFFSGFLGYFSQIVQSPFRGSQWLLDHLQTPKAPHNDNREPDVRRQSQAEPQPPAGADDNNNMM